MRFALQADASALATGMYDYTMEIATTKTGVTTTQTFIGKQAIVNRSTSEFGANWWLNGVDRLFDSSSGALLVAGDGGTLWFPKSGSTYLHADGDQSFSTLVKNADNSFTRTTKLGDKANFSTTGLLLSLMDTNANTTTLAYADRNSDGVANELITITDPFARVSNLSYTSGKVSSIAHFSGRTTSLAISGGNLTGYTLTDPDGAGPLAAPAFSFAYSSTGKISSRTNASGNVTAYAFGSSDGRLRTVTNPDATTWQVVPIETIGLPSSTSGNVIALPSSAQATVTDERAKVWKYRTDRFGFIVESITALGFVSTVSRNLDGLPLIVTEPDPDGTGPQTASVSKFGYNSNGDLTHHIAPDGGVTTATFSSTLHRLLSSTDPVGRTQSFTYDSYGNQLTSTDGAGFITTVAFNTRGLPTSVTQPDPDGAGPLTAPVTGLTYDANGRVVILTNPDASTLTFTYNSADQILTSTDELGKTTTFVYDNLGRQTSVSNRVSATTTKAYDAMSRVTKITDAVGNVTDFQYNNRGWLSKVIYPDPDGAGALARPESPRFYDGVGNLTSEGDAGGNFVGAIPYIYDSDNRKISKGTSTNVNTTETWAYDNAGRLISMFRAADSSGTIQDQVSLEYDAANRVIKRQVRTSPGYLGTPVVYFEESYAYSLAGELIATTDGRGNVRSRTYNSRGLLASETLPDPDGSGSQFRLVINHSYDNLGREIGVDEGYSRVTTAEYSSRGWITKITRPDPDGAGPLASPVLNASYNLRGDRTSITDALGGVVTTVFDNEQRPTSVTYPDPDGTGPLVSPVESTTYNAVNWITSKTDPRGGVTTLTYDNLGRQLTQTAPDPDGAGPLAAPVTTNQYNASGLWKITDALNRTVTYTRDSRGQITGIVDALGNQTNFEYNFYGSVTKQTDPDPDGAGPLQRPITTYNYDSADRMLSKTDALNGTTVYTYDRANNLTSLKDPVNNTTNFAYDGLNRLVLNSNSLSKSKSFIYNVAGNLTRTIDRNGRSIQYEYDALDRQTKEAWQQSNLVPTLTVATTQQGGPISEQQSVGWTVSFGTVSGTYTLSLSGQTTSPLAWDASAATVQAALEGLSTIGTGNVLVSITSPGGSSNRTISLTFRGAKLGVDMAQTTINTSGLSSFYGVSAFNTTSVNGSSLSEVQTLVLANAGCGTWRVAYDGQISSALWPSITAAQLKTVLDAMDGIDSVTVTGGSGSFTVTFGGTQAQTNMNQIFGDAADAAIGTATRTITTTYNAADEVTEISDSSATIAYTRDNLGRAVAISNSIAGLTPTVLLNQAFDSASNRTELRATIGGVSDFKNTYQFDALHRLTDALQQGQAGGNAVTSKHVTQAYNAIGQRTNIARYQSTGTTNPVATTDFTYDTINRLSSLTHKQGATTLSGYTYGYDGLSRPTSVNSTIEGLSTYSYDTTSQLIGADHSSQTDETYGYDANGNRNTSGYTTASNNRTTAGQGFTYTYDDEGNRLTRTETATGKVQSYEWDYRNRLTVVKEQNSSGGAIVKQVNYEYDAFNRLVRRTYDADGSGAGGATNQFWAYDEGINAVLQFDGASASNLAHRYLWSDQVDDLFADEQVTSLSSGGNTLWALSDHLGSIRDIADYNEATGVTAVANHRTLNATGKIVSETNAAVDLLFAFTGKQFDDATGLQHNLFRWYDAALGKWLSEDPISFAGEDENLNRYVHNQVAEKSDPTGLEEILIQINYFFNTQKMTDLTKSEIQRIIDDAVRKHGKKGDKATVIFYPVKDMVAFAKLDSERRRAGFYPGVGIRPSGVMVNIKENPELAKMALQTGGQGTEYIANIITERQMLDQLENQKKASLLSEALAIAIVHEGIFHGLKPYSLVSRPHFDVKDFVDASVPLVQKNAVLSDQAGKLLVETYFGKAKAK